MAARKLGGIISYILQVVLFGIAFASVKVHASPYGDGTYGQCLYGQSCPSPDSGSSATGSSSSSSKPSSQDSTSDKTTNSGSGSSTSNNSSDSHNEESTNQSGDSDKTIVASTGKSSGRTVLKFSLAFIALGVIIWLVATISRRRHNKSDV